jgi:hypothetical protein
MLSPSGKNINNDTMEYLPDEVLIDIRALVNFSMCVTKINIRYLRNVGWRRIADQLNYGYRKFDGSTSFANEVLPDLVDIADKFLTGLCNY